jgi:aminoglycoside phosphotransferase (APT) family kinase protein
VRRLVDAQFPQWRSLPLEPVDLDGWDNTTYRLGDELSVRLPNGDGYSAQVDKEQRWLPVLASSLPVDVPAVLAVGAPTAEFGRPWSVRRWIAGEPAATASIERGRLAEQLAGLLRALHRIDPRDGPVAGAHSAFRGGALRVYDDDTRGAIRDLAEHVDGDAAAATWEHALQSRWHRSGIWVHGDVTPSNLLVRGGNLAAVIDFGCAAVGDPACDLVMAWTFFDASERERFRAAVALDESTWDRARGWALWKALITLAEAVRGGTSTTDAVARFGWRVEPEELIAELTRRRPAPIIPTRHS